MSCPRVCGLTWCLAATSLLVGRSGQAAPPAAEKIPAALRAIHGPITAAVQNKASLKPDDETKLLDAIDAVAKEVSQAAARPYQGLPVQLTEKSLRNKVGSVLKVAELHDAMIIANTANLQSATNTVIGVYGDLKLKRATNCVLVAGRTAEIDEAVNCVIIAGAIKLQSLSGGQAIQGSDGGESGPVPRRSENLAVARSWFVASHAQDAVVWAVADQAASEKRTASMTVTKAKRVVFLNPVETRMTGTESVCRTAIPPDWSTP